MIEEKTLIDLLFSVSGTVINLMFRFDFFKALSIEAAYLLFIRALVITYASLPISNLVMNLAMVEILLKPTIIGYDLAASLSFIIFILERHSQQIHG
jgi:hypothetical protein